MPDSRHPHLATSHEGGVLRITIANPERGNALNGEAAAALADLLDEVSLEATDVRCVLLHGEGKHFCTGADLTGGTKAAPDTPPPPAAIAGMVRLLARTHHRAVQSAFECRVPVVAAATGRSMGFGLHLALACDLVVAGPSSVFQEPFADRGFNIDSGGSWLLPNLVGLPRAKRMLFLARPVSGQEAYDWGMVAELVADDEVESRATELAADLAARPTQALAVSKKLFHDSNRGSLVDALHAESMAIELTAKGPDFVEGMTAFAERRKPDFTGL